LRRNLDGMMSQFSYVLLVLFAMPDGGHTVMDTTQRYDSATSCNVQALIENAQATDRIYVCVTGENTDIRSPATRNQAAQAVPRN